MAKKTHEKMLPIPGHKGNAYQNHTTEANRKRGPGTREKVRSKRINLEGNTHDKKSM
jgi:hypothetical protein